MSKSMSILLVVLVATACATSTSTKTSAPADPNPAPSAPRWGNFSVSLAVRDLAASRAFYEKLGFEAVSGEPERNWLVMKSGSTKIGLFQGLFEDNILTFNPGWDENGQPLEDFDDVRDLQARVIAAGIEPAASADPASTGPAHFVLVDPDGNSILVDQHVARPASR